MKKIFLALATILASATLSFAQTYNEVADKYEAAGAAIGNENYEEAIKLLKETYAAALTVEEAAEIAASCKALIPQITFKWAGQAYNAKDWAVAAERLEEVISVAGEYENEEYAVKAAELLSDAKYEAAKSLEETDIEAAKEAMKVLVEAGEARATSRLAFLTSKQATDLQKEASSLTDAAAKKAAFKQVYELAQESLGYEESAAAYKTMAAAARNIDKWNDAILGYEKYLELKPDAKDALNQINNLAMCYEKVGNKAKAIACYKKVAAGDNEKLKEKAKKKIEALSK